MSDHKTGTDGEWLAARLELLKAEKDLTRRSDELARQRRELPWVRLDKEYCFRTDEGPASLANLFKGRSQLLIYHFMFGPEYTAGCPNCSTIADGFDGSVVHLANHDVSFYAVSRAPLESCRRTSKGCVGASPGLRRSTATSTTTSTCRTPRRSGSREPSSTTSARWTFDPPRRVRSSLSSHRALERTSRRTGERGPA